jgi:hypothetical protein
MTVVAEPEQSASLADQVGFERPARWVKQVRSISVKTVAPATHKGHD